MENLTKPIISSCFFLNASRAISSKGNKSLPSTNSPHDSLCLVDRDKNWKNKTN